MLLTIHTPNLLFFKRTCQTWSSDVIFQGEEILLTNTTGSSKSKQLSYIPDKHTLVWTHCTWHSSSARQIEIQPKHDYIIRKYCIPLLIFANCRHLLASHGEINRGTFSNVSGHPNDIFWVSILLFTPSYYARKVALFKCNWWFNWSAGCRNLSVRQFRVMCYLLKPFYLCLLFHWIS